MSLTSMWQEVDSRIEFGRTKSGEEEKTCCVQYDRHMCFCVRISLVVVIFVCVKSYLR